MIQFLPVIGTIVDKVLNVIDKSVEDKDLKEKLKSEIQLTIFTKEYDEIMKELQVQRDIIKEYDEIMKKLQVQMKELQVQRDIIIAEATGHSWLQRNWRPIIMLMFGYLIAHNYIFAPLFGFQMLDISSDVYQVIKIGLGGYVVGRSIEKAIAIKNGKGSV